MSGARVDGPEVIRDLRTRLADFLRHAGAVLGARAAELGRMQEWLRGELPRVRREAVRREEAFQEARRRWLQAEADVAAGSHSRGPCKGSSHDERVEMERARRHRDLAEHTLARVRHWIVRLEQEGGPLVHECLAHDLALRDEGARALLQLDRLAGRVDDYLTVATPPMRVDPAAGGGA